MSTVDLDWFKNTVVAKTLQKSQRFQRKTKGRVDDVWWEPKEFLQELGEYIWDKTSAYDMDHWILFFGYEGSGKSSKSLMLYKTLIDIRNKFYEYKLDPFEWLLADLILLQSEYARTIYNYSKNEIVGKQHPIIIDDAHYVFGKYYGLTAETQSLLQIARFSRDSQNIHILNTQVPQQLFADIWRERVNTYVYCFSVDVMDAKTRRIKTRYMYAAFYNMETSQILREDPIIRKPLFWRKILQRHPPDMITRFDVLFPEYTDFYLHYKSIKKFYKEYYSYLRFRGVVKGKHFEIIFRLMTELAALYRAKRPPSNPEVAMSIDLNEWEAGLPTTEEVIANFMKRVPEQTKKKLAEYGIVWKEKDDRIPEAPEVWRIDDEIARMADIYKDIILARSEILGAGIRPDAAFLFGGSDDDDWKDDLDPQDLADRDLPL